MRVLWLKAGGLVPVDSGGKIRSYHLAKELAKIHPTTLLTFYERHEPDEHGSLSSIFERVINIPLDLPKKNNLQDRLSYAANFFSPWPYAWQRYCRDEVRRVLNAELARGYDILLIDFLLAGGVVPWSHPVPKVLFTHNVEATIWERHVAVSKGYVWRAIAAREFRDTARIEAEYVRAADHVLAVSEADAQQFLAHIDRSKITVIPTGVDVDYFGQVACGRGNTIVFTGSMDWLPNEDGIFYFLTEILPLVRKSIPEVTFIIVGRHPSQRIKDLVTKNANVTLTGWVEDVREYLARGDVFVVPLRVGSGTRLKIFEAMAAGKPVVSTTIGAEGLPVRNGENVMLADDPAGFASEIVALLQNPEKCRVIGAAGKQLVNGHYSWPTVCKVLEEKLHEISERSKGRLLAEEQKR
jgi:glycosyltransferase involved in cell wall biosynthesis